MSTLTAPRTTPPIIPGPQSSHNDSTRLDLAILPNHELTETALDIPRWYQTSVSYSLGKAAGTMLIVVVPFLWWLVLTATLFLAERTTAPFISFGFGIAVSPHFLLAFAFLGEIPVIVYTSYIAVIHLWQDLRNAWHVS